MLTVLIVRASHDAHFTHLAGKSCNNCYLSTSTYLEGDMHSREVDGRCDIAKNNIGFQESVFQKIALRISSMWMQFFQHFFIRIKIKFLIGLIGGTAFKIAWTIVGCTARISVAADISRESVTFSNKMLALSIYHWQCFSRVSDTLRLQYPKPRTSLAKQACLPTN